MKPKNLPKVELLESIESVEEEPQTRQPSPIVHTKPKRRETRRGSTFSGLNKERLNMQMAASLKNIAPHKFDKQGKPIKSSSLE
jgi:hypothetical protein